ncbi:MAG TPA: hypothetical protein VHE14_05540 [Solirubrobacteraceae bacterium]|nr:hypothetical protein [Solirubrobacteraceae bacterium]
MSRLRDEQSKSPPAGLREALLDPWVLGLVALGLGLRVAYGFAHHMPSDVGDQIQYLNIGHNFTGWWSSADASRTPGYPLALAIHFDLRLGENAVRVTQAILVSAACLLMAGLATRVGGRGAGRFAALASSAYPPLIMLPSLILSDALAAALLAGAVFALAEGWRQPAWPRWLGAASALLAATVLVRPSLAICFPVLLVAAGVRLWRRPSIRFACVTAVAVLGPTLVLFAPWVARNESVAHTAAPLSTADSSALFAAGVHLPIDKTSGRLGSYLRAGHYFGLPNPGHPGLQVAAARRAHPWSILLANVRHRPLDQLDAAAFWQRELWLVAFDDHSLYGRPALIPYIPALVFHLTLLGLALVGLLLARLDATIRIVAATVAATALPYLVILPEPRYAVPAMVLLMVPAAVAGSLALRAVVRRIPGRSSLAPRPSGPGVPTG